MTNGMISKVVTVEEYRNLVVMFYKTEQNETDYQNEISAINEAVNTGTTSVLLQFDKDGSVYREFLLKAEKCTIENCGNCGESC